MAVSFNPPSQPGGNQLNPVAIWVQNLIDSLKAAFALVPTAIAFTKSFTSSDQVITSGGVLTIAHGLGAIPFDVAAFLVNQTAELGYSIGDVLKIDAGPHADGTAQKNQAIVPDATNLNVRFGVDSPTYNIIRKDTGAAAGITNANWKLRLKAWL